MLVVGCLSLYVPFYRQPQELAIILSQSFNSKTSGACCKSTSRLLISLGTQQGGGTRSGLWKFASPWIKECLVVSSSPPSGHEQLPAQKLAE